MHSECGVKWSEIQNGPNEVVNTVPLKQSKVLRFSKSQEKWNQKHVKVKQGIKAALTDSIHYVNCTCCMVLMVMMNVLIGTMPPPVCGSSTLMKWTEEDVHMCVNRSSSQITNWGKPHD